MLARELRRADGDFGRLLAPASRLGIVGRNVLVAAPNVSSPVMRAFDSPAKNTTLDEYSGLSAL